MNGYRLLPFALLGTLLSTLPTTIAAAFAATETPQRVSPASLPLPLPGATPMAPDRLRVENPWVLPMIGDWRFQLTHGQILDGRFVRSLPDAEGIRTSSHESQNPPENAFDGNDHTRWCASNATFPQWLQADLRQPRRITGVTLTWERATETYRCRLEGSLDGRTWISLADPSHGTGIGNGPVAIAEHTARFVRLTVLGSSGGGWASLFAFDIHYQGANGQQVTWTPPKADLTAPPGSDAFTRPDYNDRTWDTLAVPSNWEMAGYSLPTYNAVDDTVGLYRRWVMVPASWRGKHIVWRFDGAMDGAEIFVNGRKAGYHESGYTAFDVDLTGLVRPGQRNLFAIRLCKTTPSSECETGDYQTMGGIYRDTQLIAVPETHIADITVRTPLTNGYRDANLQAAVRIAGAPGKLVALSGQLVGIDGKPTGVTVSGTSQIGADGTATVSLSSLVKAPRLWSAEKPALYYLVLKLIQNGAVVERAEQRFGFRQIEIRNNIVLWNGRPIKCMGICRHDFWANKGFALTDTEWKTDLRLMKAANINAIRTSHYNHASRFLELCEEQGMYILDEVPFCWVDNRVKDPAFAPALISRAADTVGRDKNRPCVLAWSLGNENPIGPDTQQVFDLVQRLDPTRPAFASGAGPWDVKGQQFRDMHYPGPGGLKHYSEVDSTKAPAVLTEQPHTMYTKASQDYDPGVSDLWSEALLKTWDVVWNEPHILGSFIWEWQNQGIADHYPDHSTDFWYGPDHMRQENNKGIVSAYRVPKQELFIVKSVYSPIAFSAKTVQPQSGFCSVTVTNRYAFTDLKELTCRWTAKKGETVLRSGSLRINCPPGQSTQIRLPAPSGMISLRVAFTHPDSSEVIATRLAVSGTPPPAPPAALHSSGPLRIEDTSDTLSVTNALQRITFRKNAGTIAKWQVREADLLTGGPTLNLGEGKDAHWKEYYREGRPPVASNSAVSATPQPDGSVRAEVKCTVLDHIGGDTLGQLTTTYDIRPDAQIAVHWSLAWTAPSIHLWEAGLRLPVSTDLTRMHWERDSFFTDYPDGHLGEPSGTCGPTSVLFRASKSDLHWLTLSRPSGVGLALLKTDAPLVARAESSPNGETLLASSAIACAGPDDLSRSWFSDHEIIVSPEKPLSGSFLLRAIASPK